MCYLCQQMYEENNAKTSLLCNMCFSIFTKLGIKIHPQFVYSTDQPNMLRYGYTHMQYIHFIRSPVSILFFKQVFPFVTNITELISVDQDELRKSIENQNCPNRLHYRVPVARKYLNSTTNITTRQNFYHKPTYLIAQQKQQEEKHVDHFENGDITNETDQQECSDSCKWPISSHVNVNLLQPICKVAHYIRYLYNICYHPILQGLLEPDWPQDQYCGVTQRIFQGTGNAAIDVYTRI